MKRQQKPASRAVHFPEIGGSVDVELECSVVNVQTGEGEKAAVKRFRERVATEKEAEHLREALEARKLVDRAKAYLMNSKGMTEEQAFKTIHFGARNSSRTMREVAIEVLQQAGIPI